MGFKDFILVIFPHRWLDLKGPGNIRLFGGLGAALDEIDALIKQVRQEMRVSTAIESIPTRESEYGLPIDSSQTLSTRRATILNKMKERRGPISKDELIKALRTYGIEVTIQNVHNQHVMKIRIVSTHGEPEGFAQIQAFVENTCRAHVGKEWEFTYTNYGELKIYGLTYGQLKALGLTYGQVSTYQPA